MAVHKKEAFTQKEQDLAAFAKALAHPARISILKVLAQRNECICGEIVDILPLAQSTVSQHLKELKQAGRSTELLTDRGHAIASTGRLLKSSWANSVFCSIN